MPNEEGKDTQPAAQEEDAEVSPNDLGGGGEISAVADQLAAVTLAAKDEAGPGSTSETQQDGAAECYDPLSDTDLWRPHPPTEDCPVCLVPLPVEAKKQSYWSCCGKTICTACKYEHNRALEISNEKRKRKELPPQDRSCAFCREPAYKDELEMGEHLKERIDKGDAEAMLEMAFWCRDGLMKGFPKDETKALELLKRAADMGSGDAMYNLGIVYVCGQIGVPEDKKKGIEYLESAVKIGNVMSRCMLAAICFEDGNLDLAKKHFRLAAEAGHKDAIDDIWKLFYQKELGKADLEEILRAHQAACDEMDSEDRRRFDAHEKAESGNDDVLERIYGSYYLGYINAKQLKEVLKMHRNRSNEEEISNFIGACSAGK